MKIARFMLMGSLLLLMSGCSLITQKNTALQPPLVKPFDQKFAVEAVKRGTIAKELKNSATFVSNKKQDLFYKSSGGRLESILVKSGDSVKKGDVLAQLESDDYERRVFVQERMLEKVSLLYQQMEQQHPDDALSLHLQKIEVELSRNELKRLKDLLIKTKLIAPFDGKVTYLSDLVPGDYVVAYNIVVSISDPNDVKLVSEFSNPNDINDVNVGMTVDVVVDQNKYTGSVLQAPSSVPRSANMAQNEFNTKNLVIGIDGLSDANLIGSNADIVITLEKKNNTLIIPEGALSTYLGRKFVHILNGEIRREIDVETGIAAGNEVEITKGLTEGQKVIIN
jgi:RND family efflux transporter MFP subunit